MPDSAINLAYSCGTHAALSVRPLIAKSVDSSKLTITSVLTYPERDKAGDYVHPDGGNYAPHRDTPWVGLEHWRWDKAMRDWVYPDEDGASEEPVVVAWARESKHEPGGPYSVRMAELELKGEKVKLPVGTSYFEANDKLSMQVFRMVSEDALPGVSMEFKPASPRMQDGRMLKSYRTLGPSPIENRPALEVFRWDFHGFVHCRTPVNDGALTAVPDRLIKAVQVGKIGDEAMHPLLLKSMSAVVPKRRYFNVGSTINKADALPDQSLAETSVYDAGADEAAAAASDFPTADGLYAFAQKLKDACAEAHDVKGEHKKGMKAIRKLCDKVEAIVQEAIATADNVESDLSEEAAEDAEVEATEDEAAEVETDTDDDGIMKCIPDRLKVILKAKRFKLSEIQAAEAGNSPEDIQRLEKARKKFKRAEALYN